MARVLNVVILCFAFLLVGGFAISLPYAVRGGCDRSPLINADQLKILRDAAAVPANNLDLLIFDVAGGPLNPEPSGPMQQRGCTDSTASYGAYHIPGAQFIDWRGMLSSPAELYELPPDALFQLVLGNFNVTKDTKLVFYDRDTQYNRFAVRAYFVFKYFGFTDIQVLNGGLGAWIENEGPVTRAPPAPRPAVNASARRLIRPDTHMIASFEYVRDTLDIPAVTRIDARPINHYRGYNATGGPVVGALIHTGAPVARTGHIYGAINRWWKNQLDEYTYEAGVVVDSVYGNLITVGDIVVSTFKPADELVEIYAEEIRSKNTIVHICNEGIHAVQNYFVFEDILCTNRNVVYEGSTGEWAMHELYVGSGQWTAPMVNGYDIVSEIPPPNENK